MASSKKSIKNFVLEELGLFPHFLLWAILEWILIASLYIDGFIAFVSSAFAKIFELEPPCVLCTRVDHALARKNANTYYNESICECHKRDISSMAYCHVHRKLCDIQSMCEGCILSFATDTNMKSLSRSFRKDNDHSRCNENVVDAKRCSCCGEPLITRADSKDYSKSFSNVRGSVMETSSPPRVVSSPRAIACFTPTWKTDESRYTELKFISDSELDMQECDLGCNSYDKKTREDINSATVALPAYSYENEESLPVSPRFASRKDSLEKTDPVSETIDEAPGDGDSDLKQLQKQSRLDQKALHLLSKELEEERSASAVAANNAMAMITRLQAEKASVQMEALQYQRMMEEQAEYDQEAIQMLQDSLAKRDEHVRVMESELKSYREKYGDIRKVGIDECETEADEYYHEWRSQSFASAFGEKSEPASPFENAYEEPASSTPKDFDEPRDHEKDGAVGNERTIHEEPLLDFENEKHQLYNMLKDLENHIESSLLKDERDDDNDDDDNDDDTVKESRASLKREVSVIKERLRALEADSGFLKQTAMTLQKGEKGAELLTEIAQHLRKLCHFEDTDTTNT